MFEPETTYYLVWSDKFRREIAFTIGISKYIQYNNVMNLWLVYGCFILDVSKGCEYASVINQFTILYSSNYQKGSILNKFSVPWELLQKICDIEKDGQNKSVVMNVYQKGRCSTMECSVRSDLELCLQLNVRNYHTTI